VTRAISATRRTLLAGAAAVATAGLFPRAAASKAPMLNRPAPAFYRFKLGDFEITVVSDGLLSLGAPSDDIFMGVSKEDMTRVLTENFLPINEVELDQNVLVVNTGKQLVLFDTGTGPTLKAFGPKAGRLQANLKAAGIDPRSIDAIALTHAHPDHCFGIMSESGKRNFPKAQIYLTQADLEFWTDERKSTNEIFKAMIDGARQNLLPNRDRIVFVKDGQEIIPGIQAMATPGHTVGHTIYMISSGGQTLCNTGDIAHHPAVSVEQPRIQFVFDTDGPQAVASRLRVFDMLAASRMLFVAYHFPWPGVGHIAKQGDGFRYFASPMRTVL
jgi:glyoxylase-like metal-dependent hydrolase (beta-lactamase superfamily II)